MDSLVSLTFSIFYLSELKTSISQVADLAICLNRLEKAHNEFCNSFDRHIKTQDSTATPNVDILPLDTNSLSLEANPIRCKNWELNSKKMKTGCFFRLRQVSSHQ